MKKFLVLSLILVVFYWGRESILGFTKSDESKAQKETPIEEPKSKAKPEKKNSPITTSPKLEELPKTKQEIPKAKVDLEKLIDYALELEGSPYKASGTSPSGFDCSGYIGYVYKEVNIQLPRSSSALAMYGKRVDYQDVRPGDLLFFTGSNIGSGQIGHVGLVVEKDGEDVSMIHASSRGVVLDNIRKMTYFQDRYITATRPYEKKSR